MKGDIYMFTFNFCYENGPVHSFHNIKRVTYLHAGSSHTVDEQSILTYSFPIGVTLHLFSDNSNFVINGNNLVYIEIEKEK